MKRKQKRRRPNESKPHKSNKSKHSPKTPQHTFRGKVSKHARGFAFVTLDPPVPGITEDIFLDSREAETLVTNDIVEVAIDFNRHTRKKEGRLLRVVERGLDTAVGEFKMGAYGPCVEIIGRNLDLIAPVENSSQNLLISPGSAVLVKLKYDHMYSASPTAEILSVLAKSLDHSTDEMYIFAKYKFPKGFPTAVNEAAQRIPHELQPQDYENRSDLRKIPFVTIDGETAKDFDDAVYAERLKNGNYLLFVAVADVAHYVKPKDPMDKEALQRGNSTYLPNFVIPMLPENLSNGICSLNPRVDRLTMVCEMEYSPHGKKIRQDFYESVICSHRRCTYTEVQAFIDQPNSINFTQEVKNSLRELEEIFRFLYKNRIRRGSIDLEISETQVVTNQAGEVLKVKKAERWDAHRLIEECMLAANEAVTEFLTENAIPMLFRIHESPEKESIDKFCEIAKTLGANLSRRGSNLNHIYQSFLEDIQSHPAKQVLNYLLLRSMKQATYSSSNLGHFALASNYYTHFTSPIRRYPDLVVHRILKFFLQQRDVGKSNFSHTRSEDLEIVAQHCSKRERYSMDAEREMSRIKQVRYAQQFTGQSFIGTITNMNAKGMYIELENIAIEGFLTIDSLGHDFSFSERAMMFKAKRSGQKILLGQKLQVTIAAANPHLQRIDLYPDQESEGLEKSSGHSLRKPRHAHEPAHEQAPSHAITHNGRGPNAFLARVEKLRTEKHEVRKSSGHSREEKQKQRRKEHGRHLQKKSRKRR